MCLYVCVYIYVYVYVCVTMIIVTNLTNALQGRWSWRREDGEDELVSTRRDGKTNMETKTSSSPPGKTRRRDGEEDELVSTRGGKKTRWR